MKKIKIAFVEDNQVFFQAIKLLILENPNFDLVGMYTNAESIITELDFIAPDIVLMDIDLPGMTGIEAVSQIKKIKPATKIVMLTVHDDEDKIFSALKKGANGYLLKKNSLEKLAEEIILITEGGAPISPTIANKIIAFFKQEENADLKTLSDKELQILKLIAQGMLNKEIADKVFLSIDSVKKYTQSIYEKLHVRNRSEAVNKYLSNS